MVARVWVSGVAASAAALVLLVAPGAVSGQNKEATKAAPKAAAKGPFKMPRTKDGVPDLQGTWFTNAGAAAWDIEEHPAGLGIQPGPSIVADTPDKKIPYQEWGLAKRKDLIENHAYDDPQAHCYSSGVPRVTYAPFGFQILQAKDAVMMVYENFHLYRYIPTVPKPTIASNMKLFLGDSRAHWEGDTLVVDVTNQNGRTWLDMASNFTTENLVVQERYTRIADDTMEYEARMTDPTLYTRPWTMKFTLRKDPDPGYELLELACWEGEQDLTHYPEDQGAPKK